ncbi:hypothetical protein ACTMTJ_11020 [Phytohabitans sp. LJ34]|uniref:hypothetical protein n=1 Tax=Phytohabitans sp. LJ34 TaxID=3452217 RepID=UPI003F8BA080
MRSFWRLVAAAATPVLTAGALVATAQPAAAVGTTTITRVSWASVDARHPHRITIDGAGDAPVGTWRDDQGRRHRSRAYFTFDISRFRGTTIESAMFVGAQTKAEDCTQRPPIELWRTEDFTERSSWRRPPASLGLLYTTTYPRPCPAPRIEWDAVEGLRQAVAEGRQTLTLAVQLPSDVERDPAQGIWLASGARLTVRYNTSPEVPTDLMVHTDWPCEPQAPGRLHGDTDVALSARIVDPDHQAGFPDRVEGQFAVWPVDRPEERMVRLGNAGTAVRTAVYPKTLLAHGQTYAWQVRALDPQTSSAWTEPCYFTMDLQRPAAPSVSSSDYPSDGQLHGGPGIEGAFTFTPNGTADVVSYRASWDGGITFTSVPAESTGGPATFRFTPTAWGSKRLTVNSIDAAGNRSPATEYWFTVSHTLPAVTGEIGMLGQASRFTFEPTTEGVLAYDYRLDDGATETVTAGADGGAEVSIVVNSGGQHTLRVTTVTAAGRLGTVTYTFQVKTGPDITATVYADGQTSGGQGVPGVFTFAPRLPDVVAYRYTFGTEAARTVAAEADGRASVTWAPTGAGPITLSVVSVGADGTESEPATYSFSVVDLRPSVYSDVYHEWFPTGGPGVEATFYFWSGLPDLVRFTYRVDGGPEQTLDVTPGSQQATVVMAPTAAGEMTVTARAHTADGTVSPERTALFLVEEPLPPEEGASGL